MHRLAVLLKKVFVLIFGEMTWRPPGWLRALGRGLHRVFSPLFSFLKRHRKIVLVAALLAAIGVAVYTYWPEPVVEEEPEKVALSVRIEKPGIKAPDAEENPSLRLRFDNSAAKIDQVDKEIKPDGLILEPKIEGTWKWQGDKVLVFTPRKDWPIKQEYVLTIDESFLPEHTEFDQHELRFTTAPFTARFSGIEFVSDPVDQQRKFVAASFGFSHPVDKKSFEGRIGMMYGKPDSKKGVEKYQFEIHYNSFGTEAHVHSHNIPIPMKETPMKVTLDKGVTAQKGGPGIEDELTKSVTVPGMYTYFKVRNTEIRFARNKDNDPEQIIVLNTRLEVHEDEIKKRFKAWMLPKDKPATQDEEAETDYTWSTSEVDGRILKKSKPLPLELIPQEREHSKLHTLKFKAPVGRQIYMRLEKWTKAWGGYVLAQTYDDIERTESYPKELAIMHEGAILSTAGTKTLSVMTRGLPGVEIELARVLKSEVNHLLSQSSGRFEKPYFDYRFGPENIAEIYTEKRELDDSDPAKSRYTAIDFNAFIKKHGAKRDKGLFLLSVASWDPNGYITERTDKRLVLITDIGIIAKQDADGNHYVFVQSVSTGAPKQNVEVAVLGKNGLPIVKTRTDFTGMAKLPPLRDFHREKAPVAYMVTAGDDFAYLPIGRSDRSVDNSRFDIGGVTTDGSSDTLDAYLFSDRGIYRPGDPFRVGLIVKAVDWSKSVDGLPLELVVTDPRGQEVLTEKRALKNSGFIEFEYSTEESSPTGNYTVNAFLLRKDDQGRDIDRDLLGSTTVRVEEFLPDAMTIKTAFTAPPTDGWISPENVAATVSLRNLYGTPATDRAVSGRISLATKYLSFKGYRDYRFHDPMAAEKGYVKTLDDLTTDENGEVRFDIDLSEFDVATYALTFMAEGFEADGGRSVTSQATVTVSPLKHIVGYKADGGLGYISRDSERILHFIALNRNLKMRKLNNLTAKLYEKRYVSTLVKQYNGVFKYQSVPRKVAVSKEKISIGKEGLDHALKTDRPGEFILELHGGKTVLATIPYSVAGAANLKSSLERTAELEVKLDKKDYAPGEEIEISIKAPYKGAGLITIERDKVFAHKWFTTDETSFVQRITVPSDVDVNAYVNVAMVRNIDSPEIFMKPFCHAVMPFSLKRENRRHVVDLEVPELIKPGEEMTIEYTTPTPSKIVVFAVDEGILQVADYKTPDPLSHFLSKRALEVTTSQILDMILPEHEVYKNSANFGGGDEEEEALGRNLNPFKRKREKPVVFWSGIIDAGPSPQTVKFKIPDYFNGTVRTMAVAVSMDRLGAAERKTVVRGPFVLHSSPPLFTAPGDTFDVSVTVANNVEGSGKNAKVKVSLQVTENLEVVGQKKQTLTISEGKEKTAGFKLEAKARLGNATLTFTAKHKEIALSAKATMSVRPKNPRITTVKAGYVENGKVSIPIKRRLYQEYRDLRLSVSPLPLALADGLKAYLKEFPHGCTEQIVSQTVPALVLRDHKAFGYNTKKAKAAVKRTMRMLQSRQNSEGAFGYWSANSHVSDQQSVYAMQFLTEAKERGYPVPERVMTQGLSYLKLLRKTELDSRAAARLRAYAIYVLALNGELSAAALAELRVYLAKDEEHRWHHDVLIGYLAATYHLMQDRKEASALLKKINLLKDTEINYEDFYDNQVYRGTMIHLVAKHFPNQLDKIAPRVIAKIAKAIAGGSYNTLSSARIIYGLEAYGRRVQDALDQQTVPAIEVRQVLSKEKRPALKLKGDIIARGAFSEKARSLEIIANKDYPVFYQVSISGFDLDNAQDVPIAEGVEVIREYRDLDGNPITETTIGKEIEVVLKLRSTRDRYVSNLAIVDLLPAGFEVVLGSGANRIGTDDSDWSPSYADLREDRVLLYGSIGQDLRRFVYRIKATNRGAFTVPPAFMTSMYDPKTIARTVSSSIRVQDRE